MYRLYPIADLKAIATLVGGIRVREKLTTNHPANQMRRAIFVDEEGKAYPWGKNCSLRAIRDEEEEEGEVIDGEVEEEE